MFFFNTIDFLTSSSGSPATGTAPQPGGVLVNFFGLTNTDGNKHNQRANQFASFLEDDIKLTRKLTLNLGVRWEYDGYPSDKTGLFTDAWPSQAALVNTGTFFLGNQVTNGPGTPSNQIGTLAGYVVQSNYNPNILKCGPPLASTACGLTAPAGIFPATGFGPAYPGGATGVFFNTNKTLVHGAPIADFGPRIGLAWQPMDKFVVRAGYGIFYDAVYANLLANNNAGNPPYNGLILNSASNSLDVPAALTGGILGWQPRTLRVGTGNLVDGATTITDNAGGLGVGATSDSEFLHVPLVQQYNLDLQYEVAHSWVIDVGYVGSHGTHLYDWSRPINVAFLAPNAPNEPTDAVNQRMMIGSGAPGTPTALPFNDGCGTAARLASTCVLDNVSNSSQGNIGNPGNYLGRVSYLGYGANGMGSTNTIGDSLYNSLQIQLRHQFSKGLLLQASYTWSKSITNVNASEAGGGISAAGNVLSGSAGSNDPLDLGQQYGLAAFNRPQRLVIAYSYEFPYKHTEGLAGHLFGGWGFSGVTTIQDGEPFSVIDSNGGTAYFGSGGLAFCTGCNVRAQLAPANTGKCRADGVCQSIGVATSGSTTARVRNGWINTAAYTSTPCIGGIPNPGGSFADACGAAPNPFAFPAPDPGYPFVGAGTGFGNSGVGAIMGPGQHNWDFTAIKNTKLTEGLTLQFRAEFYNLWNHAQFNPPANNVGSPSTLGQITSSSVPPRVVQFAAKFIF